MKRFLSPFLAVIMLFTVMPFGVFATENETSERDELIAQACEIFPEYASIIRGENVANYSLPRGKNSNEKIFEERRDISETASMSITGYMDGNVYIVKQTGYGYELDASTSNIYSSTSGVRGFVSFEAACTNLSGWFQLKDVQFQIVYNGSDYFMSYGTSDYDKSHTSVGTKEVSATRIYYPLTFNSNSAGSSQAQADFEVYFSNDKVVAHLGA